MKLERGSTQRLDGEWVAIFPHLVVYAASRVGDYISGGHRRVAKYSTPALNQTYSALAKEHAQVPVEDEE